MATRVNQMAKLDKDYDFVSGVSPIRFRHETNIYGTGCGLGKFLPIMVENLNKLPEPEDYKNPDDISKKKEKGILKKEDKKDNKPTVELKKEKKKVVLVLSNSNKSKSKDFSKFSKPSFDSKYCDLAI
jgi:hypothetical protein